MQEEDEEVFESMSPENNLSATGDVINAEGVQVLHETVGPDNFGNDLHVNAPIIVEENIEEDNYDDFTPGVDFPFDQDCNELGSQQQPINHVNKRKKGQERGVGPA
ncbi:hypothetical protein Hanom_Chr09g00776591 [Helianthus anomalus]